MLLVVCAFATGAAHAAILRLERRHRRREYAVACSAFWCLELSYVLLLLVMEPMRRFALRDRLERSCATRVNFWWPPGGQRREEYSCPSGSTRCVGGRPSTVGCAIEHNNKFK